MPTIVYQFIGGLSEQPTKDIIDEYEGAVRQEPGDDLGLVFHDRPIT